MEAPPNIKDKLRRNETFQKNSEKNESYTLNIKLENNDSIYISITLQEDNKSFEDINKDEYFFFFFFFYGSLSGFYNIIEFIRQYFNLTK